MLPVSAETLHVVQLGAISHLDPLVLVNAEHARILRITAPLLGK